MRGRRPPCATRSASCRRSAALRPSKITANRPIPGIARGRSRESIWARLGEWMIMNEWKQAVFCSLIKNEPINKMTNKRTNKRAVLDIHWPAWLWVECCWWCWLSELAWWDDWWQRVELASASITSIGIIIIAAGVLLSRPGLLITIWRANERWSIVGHKSTGWPPRSSCYYRLIVASSLLFLSLVLCSSPLLDFLCRALFRLVGVPRVGFRLGPRRQTEQKRIRAQKANQIKWNR